MLAKQLKNYLESIPDKKNVMIFVEKTQEVRQLRMSDLDPDHEGNIIIDAEYKVIAKCTVINRNNVIKPC